MENIRDYSNWKKPELYLRPALLDGNDAMRLFYRRDDGVAVQGLKRADIYHLRPDAFSRSF